MGSDGSQASWPPDGSGSLLNQVCNAPAERCSEQWKRSSQKSRSALPPPGGLSRPIFLSGAQLNRGLSPIEENYNRHLWQCQASDQLNTMAGNDPTAQLLCD